MTPPNPQLTSGGNAQEALQRRIVLNAGTSPLNDTPKAQPVNTAVTVSCTCCSPPHRFVGTAGRTPEEWLHRHVEGAAVNREQANAKRRSAYKGKSQK